MDNERIARRGLVLGGLVLMASGCTPTLRRIGAPFSAAFSGGPEVHRRQVPYNGNEPPGTIVVDTSQRYLYAVEEGSWAMRYAIAVGEDGRTLKGPATIGRKAEWPSWTPTADMIRRKPHLQEYALGVSGGPHNPLGAAALYLYRGGEDTMFRLHGTNEPWTIGQAVSSGCVRLTNEDIVDLYQRTPVGTTVLVI